MEWISVNESMPEYSGCYIVTISLSWCVNVVVLEYDHAFGEWCDEDGNEMNKIVLAWMPFPEAFDPMKGVK